MPKHRLRATLLIAIVVVIIAYAEGREQQTNPQQPGPSESREEGAVRNPATKIMLAEEPGTTKSWDNPGWTGGPIVDGRWVPDSDPLTIRHGGRGDATFADGHVAPETPDFGAEPENNLAGQ